MIKCLVIFRNNLYAAVAPADRGRLSVVLILYSQAYNILIDY